MYLLLAILLFSTRSVLSDSSFCEEVNVTAFEEITACNDNIGIAVKCREPMFEFIRAIHNINQNWTENYFLLRNITRYEDLRKAHELLKDVAETYILFLEHFIMFYQESSDVSGSRYCVDMDFLTSTREYYYENITDFDEIRDWLDYYMPVTCCAEFTFGMLGNALIALIFLTNRDLWNGPNMVVFNLAVGDILMISNLALYYIRLRWIPLNISFTVLCILAYGRTVAMASSVYSMVVLSTLRYLSTVYPEDKLVNGHHGCLLLTVWLLAAVIGIPEVVLADVTMDFYSGVELKYIHLVFLCLVPLSAICIFSFLTSRAIRASLRQLPAGVEHQRRFRRRGARIICYLSFILCITYLPMSLYELSVTEFTWEYKYTFLVRVLLPINSCLNPVALFLGSQTYRKHFVKLMRCNKHKLDVFQFLKKPAQETPL